MMIDSLGARCSALHGLVREDERTRAEFLSLVGALGS